MRLAEALLERAELQKRSEALQARIVANASYQEGETPTEDAAELLEECLGVLGELERLVTAVNLTNATVLTTATSTAGGEGRTVTSLLAERETLRARHSILVRAADAAAGNWNRRQLRSELRQMSALPVKELRARADQTAAELRALDVVIQRTNWEVELRE
ncbi:DIP1984 family protein [Herbiconiux sp. YIM B11900]|uniref:DIP1984 family protein n=1 Tax=Herbiconiux sp. YIM B11900 TaxID=3404131 RepID=UPI003F834421